MENDNTVLLNPPLFALDKDAPLHYAGNEPQSGRKLSGREKNGNVHVCEKCDDYSAEISSNMHRSSREIGQIKCSSREDPSRPLALAGAGSRKERSRGFHSYIPVDTLNIKSNVFIQSPLFLDHRRGVTQPFISGSSLQCSVAAALMKSGYRPCAPATNCVQSYHNRSDGRASAAAAAAAVGP